MSSIEALRLLNDTELNASLTGAPGMSDSFTALIDSIVKRREGAVATKLEDITNLKAGIDQDATQAKLDNLNTLYDNYSTVVKRDLKKIMNIYLNLVKVIEDTVRATPSGIVNTTTTVNQRVIFKAARPIRGGITIPWGPKELTPEMNALKEKAKDLCEASIDANAELSNLQVDRTERESLRTSTRDGMSPVPRPVHEEMIIDTREELAKKEDKFLEELLIRKFSTTNWYAYLVVDFENLEHTVNDGRELWLIISGVIASIGFAMSAVARAEVNFNLIPNLDPPTLRGARQILNLLRDYESKVFNTLHKHQQVEDSKLSEAFHAYLTRAKAVRGIVGQYAADAAITQYLLQT